LFAFICKFRNKFMYTGKHRKRNRMAGYDYSRNGYYFVTICVKDRVEYLGEVKNEELCLNKYGRIVLKYWQAISDHYSNVFLDEWIIMPNHIHGIIVIEDTASVGTERVGTERVGTEQCSVPTADGINKKYGLLSKIIKSFKDMAIKSIHNEIKNHEFAWQRSFYDHIIRNEISLRNIRKYIYYNPAQWELDRNNPENLLM